MSRRKERPFHGEMATPIRLPRMPFGISPNSSEEKGFFKKVDLYIRFARMRKIVEYAKECGIDPKKLTGEGIALAAMLGVAAGVPGLRIIDETKRRAAGRPRTRKNVDDMQFLLDMVTMIRRANFANTDKAACQIWAECEIPALANPHHRRSRDKRVSTLCTLVSRSRAAGNQPGLPQLTTARQVEACEQLMARFPALAIPPKVFA